ncbi:MAG: aspartate--tRNA ligase [Candidatus Komeilibacteria bacterium]|nr:aspartate--tRNA ligase [Candidatus Komeilibacteria bacterium]
MVLKGWVNVRRNMGKIVFLDLRDSTAIVQLVCVPGELDEASLEAVKEVRPEFVIEVEGVVNERNAKSVNPNMATGTVEVLVKKLSIINTAETPPFEIDNEERQANEELRLKYRYLDLRHTRMHNNIKTRHQIIRAMREFFYAADFLEIETPFLSKSTPEGARDFLVPSRNYPGKFYALPQSPQQYKQMLMVAGLERYFQIVRCFRDEDQRGDRQAEFTQLDVEMSFVQQEDILRLTEELVTAVMAKIKPAAKISFPRMTYAEAMKNYNSDKPDIRKDKNDPNEYAFLWVTDFPMFEYKEGDQRWGAVHHPFTAINPEDVHYLEPRMNSSVTTAEPKNSSSASDLSKIRALQYDLVLNGNEVAGGSIRTHDPKILQTVFEKLGHSASDIQKLFGHLFEAFKYGVPPHGGIAFGLDRLVAVLCGEVSIREVMAFPKTSDNRDPLMASPSEVTAEQLVELGLVIEKKE